MSGASIAASDTSLAALELMADPERLKERIAQLKAAEDSANEVIALAGPASEILSMREQIDSLHAQAEETVDKAKEHAFPIVTDAEEQAQLIVEKAQQEAGRTVEEANSIAVDAQEQAVKARNAQAELQRDRDELAAAERQNKAQEESLQQIAAKLAEREQELEGEKSKLAAVRVAINNVL